MGVGSASPSGYLPGQIRQAYGLTPSSPQGQGKNLVIVGAYSLPQLKNEVAVFNTKTGMAPLYGTDGQAPCTVASGPHPCLEVRSSSTKVNTGWATEAALDSQWAHVIAPKADIIMVQAADASARSLAAAVTLAATLKPTVVSMSWGGAEFAREADWDATFSKARFVASSGDQGHGANFPSTSPNVLAVGGTTLALDSSGKRTAIERAWAGSGGGVSLYEPRPHYQRKTWLPIINQKRLVPDVAYDADPATGYSVFTSGKWLKIGGTSAGAPQWAALLTLGTLPLSNAAVYEIGLSTGHQSAFTEVRTGSNGTCGLLCSTRPGYNEVTGFGTPLAQGIIARS